MAKQQQPTARRSGGPIVRSGGPQNRALREEDQVEQSPEQIAREQFEMEVRTAAKTGLSYGKIMELHGLKNMNELYAIIQPDLVQKVDSETQEVVEPEPVETEDA